MFGVGGGSNITVVANYSALPNPTTVSGQFYWCESSQGTSWLPGSLGGTYYNSGMYYSNGVSWSFVNVPYQATQTEVNTGTNTDKFVTPSTFANASKWNTKQDSLTDVNFGSFSNGLTAKTTIVDADSVNIVDSADSNKSKKVTWANIWTNYLLGKVNAVLATFKTDNFLDATSSIQTQLNTRVRVLLNDNVNSSAVTGTVANTILKPYLIPANTLAIGDTIDFKGLVSKTNGGAPANSNFRLYTNTSNSLSGASPLALLTPASGSLYMPLDRTYSLKSGNTLESFPVGSSAPTDEATVTAAISNTAFNPAVDNYFILAIQPNNAGDSFVQTLCYITVMKQKTSI